MRFPGTLGLNGLGYTQSMVYNGQPAVLIGDTPLPANVIVTDKGGYPTPSANFAANKTAWYEVWQNGAYVGYLRPGGKNGLFIAEGSPVIWPQAAVTPPVKLEQPVIAPQATKEPIVTAIVPPAPIVPSRSENIPVIQTGSAYEPASSGGGSIIELPGAAPPANAGPADTAEVIAATPTQAGLSWIGWALLLGAGLGLLRGKKRGRKRR